MLVSEAKTPEGVIVKPSEHRNYTVSGREFSYTAPSCEIVTFNNCILTSGSWEHGLAGVVKDGKFYHERFTKDAQNFRTKSPFWSHAKDSFQIDTDNSYADRHTINECFTWFNIGQYWHWFFEDLPLIEAFRQKPDIPIVTNHLKQYQLDSLSYFPDIKERIIELDTPCLVVSNKVHAVTYPAISYRGRVASWVIEFLKDNLKPRDAGEFKRVYISRNDAVARNVTNEPAVIDMLVNEFNFVPFNTHKDNSMSNMSLNEKLKLFAAADIIVSPTGAGLTHTHAMKPGSTVIDFNHEFEVAEECGWNNIADICELNWHTLVAQTKGMPPERAKPKNSHLEINIDKLRETLQQAIAKNAI